MKVAVLVVVAVALSPQAKPQGVKGNAKCTVLYVAECLPKSPMNAYFNRL